MFKHFDLPNNDVSLISWSHAVNNKSKLNHSLTSGLTMFLEADILFIEDKHKEPIMAHPPDEDSDLTFSEFIEQSKPYRKGLKLDFKTANSVEPCLLYLNSIKHEIEFPVILNADILQGARSSPAKIDPIQFVNKSLELYPNGILSLGWTSTNCPFTSYSWSNVFEAYQLLKSLQSKQKANLEITFAIRALWSIKSIYRLLWLYKQTNCSFTIWSHDTDQLSSFEALLLFRLFFPHNVVYYDLPGKQDEFFKMHAYDHSSLANILSNSNDDLVKFYFNNKNFTSHLWETVNSDEEKENFSLFDYGCLIMENNYSLISKVNFKNKKYSLQGKFEIFSLQSQKSDMNQKDESSCIRISTRINKSNDINSSGNSINIFIYNQKGILKVFIGNKLNRELVIQKSDYFEYNLVDNGENESLHFSMKCYDSSSLDICETVDLIIAPTFYDVNQEFFISKSLISQSYGMGIDLLAVNEIDVIQ